MGLHCSLGLWKRQIFFGRRNSVALSTRETIFLVSFGGGRESKKERKIKSTRVALTQRARVKTRDEAIPPKLAASGGPFSASLPEESPPERIQPQFRKELYLRGRGGNASPRARETKEELGIVTSEYQLGEIPPNPVHIHEEEKSQPGLWYGKSVSLLRF